MCVGACVRVCARACVCSCIHTYMWISLYIYVNPNFIHTYTNAHIHEHTQHNGKKQTYIDLHAGKQTNLQTHKHTHIHQMYIIM